MSDDFVDVTFLGSAKLEVPVEVLVPKLKKFLHHLQVLFVFLRKLGKIVGVSYFSQHFGRRIFFVISFVEETGLGCDKPNRHVSRELGRLVAVFNWSWLGKVLTPTRVSRDSRR